MKFITYGSVILIRNVSAEASEWTIALDNKQWSLGADKDIMSWMVSYPQDWQVGGKCDAYFWGNGRHGQLAEAGEYSV